MSIFGLLLVGCSHKTKKFFFQDPDQRAVNEVLEKALEAIQSQNHEELSALFSVESQSEKDKFENSVNELFEYYKGETLTYDDWGGPITEKSADAEHYVRIMEATYDLKTTEEDYRIAILYVAENTRNLDSEGIQSFYIIKRNDDTNSQYAYRGDGKYTLGINIGIPNW